jgi:predicted RNA-binding Zn-ribbon protein involved in translation (DUF1610 family)
MVNLPLVRVVSWLCPRCGHTHIVDEVTTAEEVRSRARWHVCNSDGVTVPFSFSWDHLFTPENRLLWQTEPWSDNRPPE